MLFAIAIAWACEGEPVTIEGTAYVFTDDSERGNGAYGVGARGVALRRADTCEGPGLGVHFGAGSPVDTVTLHGEATDAELRWLLGKLGAPTEEGGADLFLEIPPSTEEVRNIRFRVWASPPPTWHEGPPPKPGPTLKARTCPDDSSATRCWTHFRGETVRSLWSGDVARGMKLHIYGNDTRNQHRYMVLHDIGTHRHALVARTTSRMHEEPLTPVADAPGLWFAERNSLDPGWSLTGYLADGRVIRAGTYDDVKRIDAEGLLVAPDEDDALAKPERLVPWSELLP